ncbi:MAG TPA: hypothetical protein EYM90_05965 [Phycisphaerales bacterium]|nr:hypothetical protein [Phycisphaerales bacterium]HIO52436.1 hypothetical protein [Phycisphaerales bacterium]
MCKTLILSDIHFCKRGSTVHSIEQLRPLWQGFDEVVFNGDTTELHCEKYTGLAKQANNRLKELTKEDGVQLTMICGNHDPTVSKIEHKWYWDDKILVFHGHAPIFGGAPWSWRYKHFAKSYEEQLQQSGNGFNEQLSAIRVASIQAASGEFSHHKPSHLHMLLLIAPAIFKILKCWKRYPTLVAMWTKQFAPSATYIITGHTHHAGIWERDGKVIINTGCFGFPSHPRAVVLDDDTLTVHTIKKRNGSYVLGGVCSSWNAR